MRNISRSIQGGCSDLWCDLLSGACTWSVKVKYCLSSCSTRLDSASKITACVFIPHLPSVPGQPYLAWWRNFSHWCYGEPSDLFPLQWRNWHGSLTALPLPTLQQGLQKCSHIPWASCNLSFSSSLPSKPSLFQGAKLMHQKTREKRWGYTVLSAILWMWSASRGCRGRWQELEPIGQPWIDRAVLALAWWAYRSSCLRVVMGSDTVKAAQHFLEEPAVSTTHLSLLAKKAEYDFFKEKLLI